MTLQYHCQHKLPNLEHPLSPCRQPISRHLNTARVMKTSIRLFNQESAKYTMVLQYIYIYNKELAAAFISVNSISQR